MLDAAGGQSADPIIRMRAALKAVDARPRRGRVTKVGGTLIQATAFEASLGEICRLRAKASQMLCLAEVVEVTEEAVLLTPLGNMEGLSAGIEVEPLNGPLLAPVGWGLLGRVLDGLGGPIDDGGPIEPFQGFAPLMQAPPQAMRRALIEQTLATGVKAIDGLVTVGAGQRIGIYGVPGAGKSVLLGNIVSSTEADVVVCALVGERGREVREFVESQRDAESLHRTVVIAATADRPAVERVKAAYTATAIAEYFRDQGQSVLLLVDSITRFARAQREIGLAAGEPPTRRSFPPSLFAALPKLFERAGNTDTGSITAFYTVLVEGDINADPIAEETRGLLDGHIVLSPKLASMNHYPAIDLLQSQSRLMARIADDDHSLAAGHFRRLLARYDEIELLLQVGEYQPGSDPIADEAVDKREAMMTLLRQGEEAMPFDETREQLLALMT